MTSQDKVVGYVHDNEGGGDDEEKHEAEDEAVPLPASGPPDWLMSRSSVPINGRHGEHVLHAWLRELALHINSVEHKQVGRLT